MKALTALLLSATVFTAAPAFAADETAGWQDNKPQSLESLKAPVRVVNLWACLLYTSPSPRDCS